MFLEEPVPLVPDDVLLDIDIVDSTQNHVVIVTPVTVGIDSSTSFVIVNLTGLYP